MESILPLVKSRRMVRWFTDEAPTSKQEAEIDAAILAAPSKQNLFPYHVVKLGNDEASMSFKRRLFAHPKARGDGVGYNTQIVAPLTYLFGVAEDHPARSAHHQNNNRAGFADILFGVDAIRDYSLAAMQAVLVGHSLGLATAFCGCMPWKMTPGDFSEEECQIWNRIGEAKLIISFGHEDRTKNYLEEIPITTSFEGTLNSGFGRGNRMSRITSHRTIPSLFRFNSTLPPESE